MYLNLNLIADSLKEKFELIRKESKQDETVLEQVVLHMGETIFQEGKVYVAQGEALIPKPFFEGPCAVISIGTCDSGYKSSACDYIELQKDTSPGEVLNCIQEAFCKYNRWYLDMYNAVIDEKGVQNLLDLTLPLLENPILCHDNNYHIIGNAEMPGTSPSCNDVYQIKKNNGKFPQKVINILKDTPYFEKTFETKKPTFHIDTGDINYIYNNIWQQGTYWGRTLVEERVKSFRSGDYAIIGILGTMIEKVLCRRNFTQGEHYRFLEKNLVSMLNDEAWDLDSLQEELEYKDWSMDDDYFCFILQLSKVDVALYTTINTCELIETELEDSIAFPYSNSIIGLVRVHSRSETLERIRKVIKKFNLYTGVSLLMKGFNDFPDYHKQAKIALSYGTKEDHSQWVHCFEDYCFSYMLDQCTKELSVEMIIPPTLHKLIDHDKKKMTSYVETLRAYLECDMKPSKAMKRLYIQRSTFLYRIERINEMIGVNFEDEKTKVHFLLSFQLMDICK